MVEFALANTFFGLQVREEILAHFSFFSVIACSPEASVAEMRHIFAIRAWLAIKNS